MILIVHDLSSIFYNSVHEFCSRENATDIEENILRGMILTRINYINKKLSKGKPFKVVVAIDSRRYWRRDIFSNYKAKRKVDRENSKIDWNSIFEKWRKIIEEYKQNIPFIFIEVDGAEADDIHAAIAFKLHDEFEKIINVSVDEDIAQLMRLFENIEQYSIRRKKMITLESVNYDLFTHIVKGDSGDGIPNILSDLNTLVEGIRQESVTKVKVEEWRNNGGLRNPEKFCTNSNMLERFKMNKLLIDFDEIPIELIDKIYDTYENYKIPKLRCFDYLIKNKLTKLMEDFKT